MSWYYANRGERQGPVSEDEFARLVADRSVREDTLVWKAGMPGWRPWREVHPTVDLPPPLPGVTVAGGLRAPSTPTVVADPRAFVVYGGFWLRVAARIIDGVILWFVGQIVGALVLGILAPDLIKSFALSPGEQPSPEQLGVMVQAMALMFATSLVVGLLYDLLFIRKMAATPGKLALGLRLQRADGTPLSYGRIIGRYFAVMASGFLLGIGHLLAAFDREKRALHDHLCDTRVVRNR
jgi:uncharacterized RDD family membrane protein YckC